MSVPPRTSQRGTFFITALCHERRRLFQHEQAADLLFQTLQHYRGEAYSLHAFVIMPEHLHLILTPLQTLERAMQSIKGGFSKRYHDAGGRHRPVWQKGFTDHRIRDRDDFDIHLDYIIQNPVKRGLVASPELFRWSSAYRRKS